MSLGVAALIVALAITNGFHELFSEQLIGASSHITVVEKNPEYGIEDYNDIMSRVQALDHVEAVAPTLYGEMMITTPGRSKGCVLKGVIPDAEIRVSDLLSKVVEGSFHDLENGGGRFPGIVLGQRLADAIGARVSTIVTVMTPQGELTPLGMIPALKRFQVVGIFETGYFELDNLWAVCLLRDAQRTLSIKDVVNSIEVRLSGLDASDQVAAAIRHEVGGEYAVSTWIDRNPVLFSALEAEKLVTALIIGMTMLVAAMNILISLVMFVIEKTREIAILMSMGARKDQIRRIFVWQGLIVGVIGTAMGLVLGHLTCWICDRYRLIPLNAEAYGLEYVPFAPQPIDGILVASAAVAICYLITVYPSGSAARVAPAETLRYE